MDWDLWNAPYNPDVIEEDALREKSCIQVLKILITKADTEIDELEQNLIFLQSELAWIENEEWSEIGHNALTEKIDSLDSSMKSLRNEDVGDVEVHLLMHTQPAERLHEILQALLDNYLYKKDLQPTNAGVTDSSFQSLKVEAGFSAGGIEIKSSSNICTQKERGMKSEFDTKEEAVVLNLSSSCADKEIQRAEKREIQDADFVEDIAAKDSNKLNENENENADQRLCISSVLDYKEGFSDIPLNITNEPTIKQPQEGSFDSTLSETDKPITENPLVTPSEIKIPPNSSEIVDRKEKEPLQTVKVEATLTEKENCALTSLLEQQDKNENTAVTLQPKEEDKSMLLVEVSTMADDEEKLNSSSPPDLPQDSKTKGNNENSSPLNFPRVDSSWALVMKGKKRQKSIMKPGLNADGEKGGLPDENLSSVSLPCKKTKSSLNIPLVSELQNENAAEKALTICDLEVEPIPSYSEMEKMKLAELRKLAKGHKLKHSQLNKKEVIQMLLACRNGGK